MARPFLSPEQHRRYVESLSTAVDVAIVAVAIAVAATTAAAAAATAVATAAAAAAAALLLLLALAGRAIGLCAIPRGAHLSVARTQAAHPQGARTRPRRT